VRRKLVMITMAVLLPMGFIATIGAGVAAAKGAQEIDGNISCNLSGTISIKPAISSTKTVTGNTTISAKLTNGSCVGVDGTTTTPFISSLTSKESLKYTIPPSSPPTTGCATLAGGGSEPVPASKIAWKGTGGKIDDTDLAGSTANVNDSAGTITITGAVTSGWSETATYSITLYVNEATIIAGCDSKKGLSKITATDGPGDNLEIGPAF
jgi:hypothetical protein